MADTRLKAVVILCLFGALSLQLADAQVRGLRANFYSSSCPNAETIIRAAVDKAFQADPSIGAGLIRMFFHDCFVRGCDASVLIDNADSEKLGAPNANSLRGFEVLDEIKANLEAACPGKVSCADVIAYAARDAMEIQGKLKVPNWLAGRRDGSTSISAETLTELPAPFSNYTTLVQSFRKKNFTAEEMVLLSGAHTVGIAKCGTILGRLYNFGGTGASDPALDPSYATTLKQLCPSNAPGNTINMEMATPNVLDNKYFIDVASGKGLFESDNALRTTAEGRKFVDKYRTGQIFSPAFIAAMRKMGNIGVLTGNAGKIRTVCNVA